MEHIAEHNTNATSTITRIDAVTKVSVIGRTDCSFEICVPFQVANGLGGRSGSRQVRYDRERSKEQNKDNQNAKFYSQ